MVEPKSDASVRVFAAVARVHEQEETAVTKQEFVDQVAAKAGLAKRDAAKAVDAFLESITRR